MQTPVKLCRYGDIADLVKILSLQRYEILVGTQGEYEDDFEEEWHSARSTTDGQRTTRQKVSGVELRCKHMALIQHMVHIQHMAFIQHMVHMEYMVHIQHIAFIQHMVHMKYLMHM